MLTDIQTLNFFFYRDADSYRGLDNLPEDQRDSKYESSDTQYACKLRHKQPSSTTKEQTVARGVRHKFSLGKQTDAYSTENAAD